VVPGGFGGGEASSRGGGALFGKDGDTILGSAEASSVTSRRSGPITRGGGNLDTLPRGGGVLSPLSFQPGDIGRGFSSSVSLTGISLKGQRYA
jgi:hypothetical protein